jgi:hypothetical protein
VSETSHYLSGDLCLDNATSLTFKMYINE